MIGLDKRETCNVNIRGAVYKVSPQTKGMDKNSAERTKRSIMRIKPHNTLPEGVHGYVEWFDEFVVQWHIINRNSQICEFLQQFMSFICI